MGTGLSQKYKYTYGSTAFNSGNSILKESTATYHTRRYEILRNSTGVSNINDNVRSMSDLYPVNKYGQFGEKGDNCRIMICEDPISESKRFYDLIGTGGQIRKEVGREITITRLDDNTEISYRVITSTKDSPAVFINVMKVVDSIIHTQKIHFIGK